MYMMIILMFYILGFAFILALIAGAFAVLYFVVKRAVKDGMVEANIELQKNTAQRAETVTKEG